jgi:hypothetical protein
MSHPVATRGLASAVELNRGYMRCSVTSMAEGLSEIYQDLLSGSYDCVDRIVLNGYYRMGHEPAGFRTWWRR